MYTQPEKREKKKLHLFICCNCVASCTRYMRRSLSWLGGRKVSSHHPYSFSQNVKLVCADSFHAPRENLRDPLNSSKLAARYITTANTFNSFQSIGNIWNIYTKLSVISLTLNYHTRYDVRSFTENSLALFTHLNSAETWKCLQCLKFIVHEVTLKMF